MDTQISAESKLGTAVEMDALCSALMETCQDAILLANSAGEIVLVSPATERIFGMPASQAIGKPVIHLIDDSHQTILQKQIERCFAGHNTPTGQQVDLVAKNAEGKCFPVEASCSRVPCDNETFVLILLRNTTERIQLLDRVLDSEAKFSSVIDSISVGIAVISKRMEILSLNNQMKAWFPDVDVSQRPLCYRSFNSPPRESICDYCPTCKTLQDGRVHEAISQTPRDGKLFNYRVLASPLRDAHGNVIAAVEIVEDITERLHLKAALEESKQCYQVILDSVFTGVMLIDADNHTILDVNPSAAEMIGLPKEQIVGQKCTSFICLPENNQGTNGHAPLVCQSEQTLKRRDGTTLRIRTSTAPLQLDGRACLVESFHNLNSDT